MLSKTHLLFLFLKFSECQFFFSSLHVLFLLLYYIFFPQKIDFTKKKDKEKKKAIDMMKKLVKFKLNPKKQRRALTALLPELPLSTLSLHPIQARSFVILSSHGVKETPFRGSHQTKKWHRLKVTCEIF